MSTNSSALERARAANAERRIKQPQNVPLLSQLGKSFRASLEAIGLMEEAEAPSVTAAEADAPVTEKITLGLQRSMSRVMKTYPRTIAHAVFSRQKDSLFGKKIKARPAARYMLCAHPDSHTCTRRNGNTR